MAKKSVSMVKDHPTYTNNQWLRCTSGVTGKYPLPLTISIWFKPTSLADFGKTLWGLCRSTSTTQGVVVWLGIDGKIYLFIEGNGPTHRLVSSNAISADGTWHLAVCTITDMDNAAIFLDGTKTTGDPTATTSYSTYNQATATVALGRSETSAPGWYYEGLLAFPAVYGSVVSDTQAGYLATKYPNDSSLPTLLSYYDFEEDSLNDLGSAGCHMVNTQSGSAGICTFSTDVPSLSGGAAPALILPKSYGGILSGVYR